jgi:hypothetical protein
MSGIFVHLILIPHRGNLLKDYMNPNLPSKSLNGHPPQDRTRFNSNFRRGNHQVLRANVKRRRRGSEIKGAKSTSVWCKLGVDDF